MSMKKKSGNNIFVMVVCILAFAALFMLQRKFNSGHLMAYNGLISQVMVIVSTILVIAASKKGFIAGIIINLSAAVWVGLMTLRTFMGSKGASKDLSSAKEELLAAQGELASATDGVVTAEAELAAAQAEGIPEKIAGLTEKLEGLKGQVGGLTGKVTGLSEKVEGLTDKVDGLTTAVQAQLPGILIPICTAITIAIIYIYLSRTQKMHEELSESYETLMETNRIIKEKDEKLTYLAYYDLLTGMPNRQLFIDKLEDNISKQAPCVVIYTDIDDFKKINDVYGHNVGDAMLIAYAERLKRFCGEINFVSRIGGDEFGIILNGNLNESAVLEYIEKIRGIIAEPVEVNGALFRITMSYGIAFYPQDGRSTVEIFRCTDVAVFNAKANGKDRPYFFSQQSQYMR